MRITKIEGMLKQAIEYIEMHNNELRAAHTDPVSGKVEPEDVAEIVQKTDAWLEGAKTAQSLQRQLIETRLNFPWKELPYDN